jgi:pimeloyl-ACP methyl ester carboxylesterase
MRSLGFAALLVALTLASPALAQWQTVDTVKIKGAYGLIIIPQNWNGGLFIYAHGYSADDRLVAPFPTDLTPDNATAKLNVLFQATILPPAFGYASATTTFRSEGWYIKDSIKDIENLRRYFVKKYKQPTHTYLWGHSGGGLVTSTVIEYFPDTYEGAMPMCGPGAGARRNFNGAFDLRVLYEYLCSGVPGAQFQCGICSGSKRRCLVDADCKGHGQCSALEDPPKPEDGLTRECTKFVLKHPDTFSEDPTSPGGDFVTKPVTACFGDLTNHTPPTPEQQARRDFFVRGSQIPESFITTDMFFASIGMAEVVHRRTKGKHPWGNEGVQYDPPLATGAEKTAFNAGAIRVTNDASATKYMDLYYEPKGKTKSKVLTIHALDDGLVIPENETKYRQAFEAAGTADQLVQLFTPTGGHCGFITALVPAIPAITGWVEHGQKPDPSALAAACPACGFTLTTPGPWGLKVVERDQSGVDTSALVCDGSPGDCPPDATCDAAARHCTP